MYWKESGNVKVDVGPESLPSASSSGSGSGSMSDEVWGAQKTSVSGMWLEMLDKEAIQACLPFGSLQGEKLAEAMGNQEG